MSAVDTDQIKIRADSLNKLINAIRGLKEINQLGVSANNQGKSEDSVIFNTGDEELGKLKDIRHAIEQGLTNDLLTNPGMRHAIGVALEKEPGLINEFIRIIYERAESKKEPSIYFNAIEQLKTEAGEMSAGARKALELLINQADIDTNFNKEKIEERIKTLDDLIEKVSLLKEVNEEGLNTYDNGNGKPEEVLIGEDDKGEQINTKEYRHKGERLLIKKILSYEGLRNLLGSGFEKGPGLIKKILSIAHDRGDEVYNKVVEQIKMIIKHPAVITSATKPDNQEVQNNSNANQSQSGSSGEQLINPEPTTTPQPVSRNYVFNGDANKALKNGYNRFKNFYNAFEKKEDLSKYLTELNDALDNYTIAIKLIKEGVKQVNGEAIKANGKIIEILKNNYDEARIKKEVSGLGIEEGYKDALSGVLIALKNTSAVLSDSKSKLDNVLRDYDKVYSQPQAKAAA